MELTPDIEPQPPPLCAITNQPARYRDPKTGLPYHNAYAYREIRRLAGGEFRWSALLGCWVGEGSAARGVPARFLDPEAPAPASAAEAKGGGKGGAEKGGQSGTPEGADKENQAGAQSEAAKGGPKETAAQGQEAGAPQPSGGTPAPVPAPS